MKKLPTTSFFYRWNDSTLRNPLEASKTAWPVAHKESIFLPEFPITTDLLQKEYVIQKTIAKGAFGEVYKVNQVKEGKEYALKVLSKGKVSNHSYFIVYSFCQMWCVYHWIPFGD